MTTLAGLFHDKSDARAAVADLESHGFASEDVSYVEGGGTSAAGATGKGAAIGGVSGLLLGAASLAMPGLGPILAAGPIVAALAGAATGGMLGALADLGMPEPDARRWSDEIRKGAAVVLVRAGNENGRRARAALAGRGAAEVSEHAPVVQSSGGADPSAPANYGDEGGSSQWGQSVLRPDGIAERVRSRDNPKAN